MPSHNQTIVSPVPTEKILDKVSRSDTATMVSIFSASPIYVGEVTDASQKKEMQDVLDEEINDGGHTFGTFDPNYSGAPDLEMVKTGGAGRPATPYVPNPTSPGPGSMNADDQAAAPDGYMAEANVQWGSGVGHADNPSASSARIAGTTLGAYISGKSSE